MRWVLFIVVLLVSVSSASAAPAIYRPWRIRLYVVAPPDSGQFGFTFPSGEYELFWSDVLGGWISGPLPGRTYDGLRVIEALGSNGFYYPHVWLGAADPSVAGGFDCGALSSGLLVGSEDDYSYLRVRILELDYGYAWDPDRICLCMSMGCGLMLVAFLLGECFGFFWRCTGVAGAAVFE